MSKDIPEPWWDEPEYQDEVKHALTEVTGVVIAKYLFAGETFFDIRGSEGKIYYHTHAKKWMTTRKAEDII